VADGPPPTGRGETYQWFKIDDFTPGVYDNSFISSADPKISAPMGSADADNTFCCAALGKTLGLGPLPALATSFGYSPSFPGSLVTWYITGFIDNPGLNNIDDELIIILEGDDGGTHYVLAYSYDVQGASTNVILNSTSGTVGGIFGAPYPVWTRMNATGTGNPSPGLIFPGAVTTDASGSNGHVYLYPPIAAPTTFAVQDLIVAGSSVTGQTIAYGDRILALAGVNYSWPAGSGINTNENINFTDPPRSSTYGNQQTILGSEIPWGYGAWGTQSVGELMLIKKYGGGLIVYGDIFSPTSVVEMPGVQPTGDFVGQARPSVLGLVYCSEDRGAWVWNGGNTSKKISSQLRDNFYDCFTNFIASNNYGFNVQTWQDWLLFSNNFMYNPDTNSWWVLYPTVANGTGTVPGQTFWWYTPGRFGDQMYAAPLGFTHANNLWFSLFDNKVPAPHWQWQSLPIHVTPNSDRVVDVREVVLRVSDPSNSGNCTVSLWIDGTTYGPVGGIGNDPTPIRFNTAVNGVFEIILRVNGDNAIAGSSPVLHSIDVGYSVRAEVPVSN
jgi:hypothetical protein